MPASLNKPLAALLASTLLITSPAFAGPSPVAPMSEVQVTPLQVEPPTPPHDLAPAFKGLPVSQFYDAPNDGADLPDVSVPAVSTPAASIPDAPRAAITIKSSPPRPERRQAPSLIASDAPVVAAPLPVESSALGAPSIAGVGVAAKGEDTVPTTVWQGSDAATSEALITSLHAGIASETLRGLVIALLSSNVSPPSGAGDEWFADRVNALVAIGADDAALALLNALPGSMRNAGAKRAQAELLLIRGEAEAACRLGAGMNMAISEADGFWPRLAILCQANAGKPNEASVGMDVLRETNPQALDPFFQDAIRKMGDRNAVIKTVPRAPTLFDVALLRLAGSVDRLKDRMDGVPAAALRYLAADTNADVKLKDNAAEKARAIGLLPPNLADKIPEPPFSKPLASDVTTLVTALASGKPANAADQELIARLPLGEGASAGDVKRVARLLALMEPFGYRVPPSVLDKIAMHHLRYDGDSPSGLMVAHLDDAASSGRVGETLIIAALSLGATDPARAQDLSLVPVVRALKTVGFAPAARRLATEAVKSYR